jgi:hypothetical protein
VFHLELSKTELVDWLDLQLRLFFRGRIYCHIIYCYGDTLGANGERDEGCISVDGDVASRPIDSRLPVVCDVNQRRALVSSGNWRTALVCERDVGKPPRPEPIRRALAKAGKVELPICTRLLAFGTDFTIIVVT